jgi:glycine hydroxymethyltransferase
VSLPGESGSEPTQGSGGLRLGTPAVTTRGFGDAEIRALGGWIADILDAGGADAAVARVRAAALELCAAFPVYGRVAKDPAR